MAGRPRKLTDKLKAHILSLIADGLTIRELFSRDDVPITWQSFRAYLIKDKSFVNLSDNDKLYIYSLYNRLLHIIYLQLKHPGILPILFVH